VAVAPRVRTWGATTDELARAWPGAELVVHPGLVWTNAAAAVFTSLTLGGVAGVSPDRGAERPGRPWGQRVLVERAQRP
jgi:hypothetical protein